MFNTLTIAAQNELLMILQQIANPAMSKEPGYLDRKTCGSMARRALELIGQPFVDPQLQSDKAPETADVAPLALLPGHYTVNTDGGCKGNPGPAGWGVVVQDKDDNMVIQEGNFIGRATNQVAELSAAINGLKFVPEGSTVLLVSDSQYTLKGLTEWRKGWESRGMRNGAGEVVANLEYWRELYALADKRKVTTKWVKGHSGAIANEICDQLANRAIKAEGRVTNKPQYADI